MQLDNAMLQQVMLCIEDVYILDEDTKELLYVSDSISGGDSTSYIGKRCYEVLRGLSERCPQCPHASMCEDHQAKGSLFYRWDLFMPQTGCWQQVRHRIATIDGRRCRVVNCNLVDSMMQLGSDAIKEMGVLMSLLEENSKIKHELELESTHDRMTGLFNRNRYMHDLEMWSQLKSIGILYLDINNLKTTNDSLGHTQGDLLIRTTADCMQSSAPSVARCYRIGGDEFVMLIPDCSPEQPELCRQQFVMRLADANRTTPAPCLVASGSSYAKQPYGIAAQVATAEQAMYEDKRAVCR